MPRTTSRFIITGASSGIGAAAAHLLASLGHELVLVARRGDALADVAEACRNSGAQEVIPIVHDLEAGPPPLAHSLAGREPMPLGLVNNAGQFEIAPFAEMPWDRVQQLIQVNLTGLLAATHAALPLMLASGGGRVVNVLSVAAVDVYPHSDAYAAAKAGGLQFTKTLNRSYGKAGIRSCALLPGAVDTAMWADADPKPPHMLMPTAVAAEIVRLLEMPEPPEATEMRP